MARSIFYRVKSPVGPWQRATGTVPFAITGLVADIYEVDDGSDVLVNATVTDVPAQMAAPTLVQIKSNEFTVDLAVAPNDNNSPITSLDIRYSTDQTTWTEVLGVTDPYVLGSLTAATLYYVQTRAVNAVGPGPWSASASATTNTAATFPNQTARIGALTLGGAGGYQIVNSDGIPATNVVDAGGGTATGYTLSTSGVITPTTDGSLAGQDSTTINVTADQGSATITLSVPANVAHVSNASQLEIAAELSTRAMGDIIELRDGEYNSTDADFRIKRGAQLTGTWNGSNYCVVKSENPYKAIIGHIGIDGITIKDCYFSFEKLTFNCDVRGAGQTTALIGRNQASYVRVENNKFIGTENPARYNRGDLKAAIDFNSTLNGNIIITNNEMTDVSLGINIKGRDSVIQGNTGVRLWEDCIKVSSPFARGKIIGNSFTDKKASYTPYTITNITYGTSTVVTVTDATGITVTNDFVLVGMTGADELAGRVFNISAVTGNDVTIDVNSTGYTPYTSGGTARYVTDHPDFIQGSFSGAAAGDVDDIIVRGNVLTRGVGSEYMAEGQGIFLTDIVSPVNITNALVEGNIIEHTMVNGITIDRAVNCTIQNNVCVKKLGHPLRSGTSRISVTNDSGCIIRGNVTNNIASLSATTSSNQILTVDSASYAAAFDAPSTGEGATVGTTAYAPKAGGPLATASPVIGALPHQSFVSPYTFTSPWVSAPVLSNPVNAASGPNGSTWSVDTTGTTGSVYWVVTASATTPTAAQIKAGQDNTGVAAPASGSVAVSAAGTVSGTVAGLTPSTVYYTHFVHENASAATSNAISAASFTTTAVTGVAYAGQLTATSGANIGYNIDLTPLNLVENDFVLVSYGAGTVTNRTITYNTAGYTEFSQLFSNGTNDTSMKAAWKFMGATPDTTLSVSSTGSSAEASVVTIQVFKNVNLANPIDVAAVTRTVQGTRVPDPNPITPVTADSMIVVIATSSHNDAAMPALTAPYLSNVSNQTFDGGSYNVSALMGSVKWNNSGAYDPAPLTITGDSTSDTYATMTLALRPA
jgi:hypothetical protein